MRTITIWNASPVVRAVVPGNWSPDEIIPYHAHVIRAAQAGTQSRKRDIFIGSAGQARAGTQMCCLSAPRHGELGQRY
jgi:hypothetical protein